VALVAVAVVVVVALPEHLLAVAVAMAPLSFGLGNSSPKELLPTQKFI